MFIIEVYPYSDSAILSFSALSTKGAASSHLSKGILNYESIIDNSCAYIEIQVFL